MELKPIKTKHDYENALKEIDALMDGFTQQLMLKV